MGRRIDAIRMQEQVTNLRERMSFKVQPQTEQVDSVTGKVSLLEGRSTESAS